jgi:hypothetical protein
MSNMLFSLFFLASSLGSALTASDRIVVFDGGEKNEGKAWAHPRGISKMEISWQHPFSNKTHLDFIAKCQRGWAGAGWNWMSWKGEGLDLTGYKNLVFHIGVSDDPIKDIYVQLTSNDGSGVDAKGPEVEILPLIEKRKKYIRISIPLKKLFGGKLNPKSVWGINFNVFGVAAGSECRIYIDQIEFTK